LRFLTHVFRSGEAVSAAESAVRDILNMAAAFPRPIELAVGQQVMLHFEMLMTDRVADLRRTACDNILEALGTRRIWISQEYADLFADVRRAGPEYDQGCSHCGNEAIAWLYEDRITILPQRHVLICNRCGIVSDAPVGSTLSVFFPTIGTLRSMTEPVDIQVTNTADTKTQVSLAVQLNAWKTQCSDGTGCRIDLDLAPGETRIHTAELHFPKGFQDDILSVQLFIINEPLETSFYSQKVQSIVRPAGSE